MARDRDWPTGRRCPGRPALRLGARRASRRHRDRNAEWPRPDSDDRADVPRSAVGQAAVVLHVRRSIQPPLRTSSAQALLARPRSCRVCLSALPSPRLSEHAPALGRPPMGTACSDPGVDLRGCGCAVHDPRRSGTSGAAGRDTAGIHAKEVAEAPRLRGIRTVGASRAERATQERVDAIQAPGWAASVEGHPSMAGGRVAPAKHS